MTKAPVTKSLALLPSISKDNAFFREMTQSNLRIGKEFQDRARGFFSQVDLFKLDQVFEEYHHRKTKLFENYDLIVPVGGDGTFLSCSHFLPDNRKLMLGVNSNPKSSFGFLLELKYGEDFGDVCDRAFRKLAIGDYEVLHRKRFEVFFDDSKDTVKNNILGDDNYLIGLNDIFYGSLSQATTASYLFSAGDGEAHSIRSTGCLIYTGSGSSAWAQGMNQVSESTLVTILESLSVDPTPERLQALREKIRRRYQFSPTLNRLGFKHREILACRPGVPEDGAGIKFSFQNKIVGAFLAVDGFEHNLEMDERVRVQLSSPDKDLLCIHFN